MAKRGPKGTNNIIKMAKGTLQPCRSKEDIHKSKGSNSDLVCPDWLGEEAVKLWNDNIKLFDKNGFDVSNYGDALAHYCALGGDIIDIYISRRKWTPEDGNELPKSPPVSWIQAYRVWATEFYNTLASGHLKARSKKTEGNQWENIKKKIS